MEVFKKFENEIESYLTKSIEISEGVPYSEYKLKKRISIYANQTYPKGKLDKQFNYKYWIDIISPRIDSEVKNVDFDRSNIVIYSDQREDVGAVVLMNLALKNYLRNEEEGIKLNDSVEEGSGWGNVVWKKVKGGYEKVNLKDFYVINTGAVTLDDSPVIERHIMTQSEIRAKGDVWNNIDKVIKECGNRGFSITPQGTQDDKESPYYEIYERTGEISVRDLKEAQEKKYKKGDEDKYVLAKVIVSGLKKSEKTGKYVLFAEELSGKISDYYKEYHRGRYNGRWFRVGIYELLFDIQTRANEISNQIALGLKWASKMILRSQDKLLANNILTDLKNGDVIKSADLQQVNFRMEGLDQLIADWNRLMETADKLCNSYEVVAGESMPSGTPFRTTGLLNTNANKLFDFIREKLGLALEGVFQDWVMPDLIKKLKQKEILRITGDGELLKKYYKLAVNGWYLNNLLSFPPHTNEQAEFIKQKKLEDLQSKPEQFVDLLDGWLDGVKPRVYINITGENVNLIQELETLSTFIALESDPVRRTALIEKAMAMKNIDASALPKTEVQPVQPQTQTQQILQQPQGRTVKSGQPT